MALTTPQAAKGAGLYLQAAAASKAGRRAEARNFLLQAADEGFADAHFTLATMDLQGLEVPKDPSAACARLLRAADLGSNPGRRLLAALTAAGYGRPKDWAAATRFLIEAARAGEREALREAGLLLEIVSPGHAASDALLVQAARAGDGLAAVAVLRRSLTRPVSAFAPEMKSWAAAVESARHPLAPQLRDAGRGELRSEASEIVWDEIGEILSGGWREPAVPTLLTQGRPRVAKVDDFASIEECDYLIGKTAPMLRPSAVIDERTGRSMMHPVRTSSNATLWPIDQDLVVHCINERAAALAQSDPDCAEMLSVLCYQPNQQYLPHFDYLSESAADARELARAGQRTRTVLVYLNDDYDGGETHFLANDLRVKGRRGSALVFDNTLENGEPDRSTRHAGLAVTRGTKWLGSKWFRARRFTP